MDYLDIVRAIRARSDQARLDIAEKGASAAPEHRHFFYDTEFMEYAEGGESEIELISLGIVDEAGREFYAINKDADLSKANAFVRENVLPHLPDRSDPAWMRPQEIAEKALAFLTPDNRPPHMWSWYGAYDYVVFCGLYGPMVNLPEPLQKYVKDLKAFLPFFEAASGREISAPEKPENAHDALADARWLRSFWGNVEAACGGLAWFEVL